MANFGRSYFSENFPEIWQYFLGLLFIAVVLLFPAGIVGSLMQGVDWVVARLRRQPVDDLTEYGDLPYLPLESAKSARSTEEGTP